MGFNTCSLIDLVKKQHILALTSVTEERWNIAIKPTLDAILLELYKRLFNYLDNLPPETVLTVESAIAQVPEIDSLLLPAEELIILHADDGFERALLMVGFYNVIRRSAEAAILQRASANGPRPNGPDLTSYPLNLN